ncbi:MAG: hypothetical protein NTX25_21065, partial [Proteobacteria bacterium]|nr:hypothetical protein [Pseudomonadota bacterium]
MFRRLALKKITEIANLRSTCCAMMLLDSTDAYRLIILSSLAHPSFPRKSLQFLQFFTFVLLALQVAYSWLTQGSFRDLA